MRGLHLLGVALAAAVASGLTVGPGPATGMAAAAQAAAGIPPITLVSQTPWVVPEGSFDLRLRIGTSSTPRSQLALSVSVYSCLSSVSAFDQSVTSAAGPSAAPIDSTRSPLAVTGLPATSDGAVDLTMPVSVGSAGTAPAGGFAIDLSTRSGQCAPYPNGVYPVRVQLVDTSTGQVVGGLTTHLIYTGTPTATRRLRVAVVLPIGTTLEPAANPTTAQLAARPAAALAPPSAGSVAAISGTVAAISQGHPSVPVTLETTPQTVGELAATGHQSIVAQLVGLSATPSVHQFASSPFVPVDASSLVNAGLAGELALQVARGSAVLSSYFPRTSSAAAGGVSGPLGAWFSNDGVDTGTLAQLQQDGYSQVVVPAASVPNAPANNSTAEPFPLSSAAGTTMTALAANADLAARFTGSPGDPVLAASQLVAELAQIYFEKPNDTTPRIVVAVAPNSWTDDPAFVSTLLGALDGNPVLEPVKTTDLFSTLPLSTCHNECRTLASSGGGGLPAAAIRAERQRVTGLATATSTATARGVTTQLGDLVLAGESEHLHPAQQSAVLRNAGAAVGAQLGQLQVSGDRTVTLTSQRGRVPVTIYSTAPYPVTGTLTLTSDKLTFPNGQSQTVTVFPSHYNVFPFNVETRASGLFKVDIALSSPGGGLTISSGQVDVRSTATSVVGVILSLGAVAVLVVWWLRTSRRRRSDRRRDEAGGGGPAVGTT